MPFCSSELEALFAVMLEKAACPGASVELTLLDDAAMESLHGRSLGCPGPTNILAFPAKNTLHASVNTDARIGSLALSVDTLRRECFLYGQDLREHCIRLLAHGLAHLMGYDHGPAMDALAALLERAAMEAAAPSSHSAS